MIDSRQKSQDIESSNQLKHQINLNIIGGGCRTAATPRPIGMEKLPAGSVDPFVLVCTKVVPLCLQQVGRQSFAPEAIEVG